MKSSEYYPIFLALLGILFFSMMDAVMKAQALAMGVFAATFWRAAMGLSLIHISEPTRRRGISYAVFCCPRDVEESRMPSSA